MPRYAVTVTYPPSWWRRLLRIRPKVDRRGDFVAGQGTCVMSTRMADDFDPPSAALR